MNFPLTLPSPPRIHERLQQNGKWSLRHRGGEGRKRNIKKRERGLGDHVKPVLHRNPKRKRGLGVYLSLAYASGFAATLDLTD